MVDAVQVGYEFLSRNNGNRASEIGVYLLGPEGGRLDSGSSLFPVLTSPTSAVASPHWQGEFHSAVVSGLNLLPGQALTVGWLLTDFGGSGARDEFALDDLSVRVVRQINEPAPSGLLALVGCGILLGFKASRRHRSWGGQGIEDRATDFDGTASRRRG